MHQSKSKGQRNRKPAYDRGLDLLARRMHFAAELRTKLTRRGYPDAEVDGAIDRLVAGGYLNEQEAAHMLVRSLKRRGYGRRRLELDLRRRGADETAAGAALDCVGDEDELERARSVAARWRSTHPARDAAALARHLERRGFAPRTIGAVVFDSADESAEQALPEEAAGQALPEEAAEQALPEEAAGEPQAPAQEAEIEGHRSC